MCEVVLPPFQQVQSLAQHHQSYPLGYEQPQVLQVHEKSLPWPSGVDSDAPPSHPEVSPINGAWREAEPDNGIPPPPPYSTHPPPPSFDSAEQSKVRRAQQACEPCRARKSKCDEGRPACSHCKENNLICVYKELPPTKQEKATQLVLDRIQQLEDRLEEKISQLRHVQVDNGLQISQMRKQKLVTRVPPIKGDRTEAFQQAKLPNTAKDAVTLQKGANAILNDNQALMTGGDGELSIPVKHSTAAHKLLSWPSVKRLLDPKEYDEDYVMRLEEKRGHIRVYGRGEGDEAREDSVVSPPSTNSSAAEEEVHVDHHSPSGPWGGANQRQSRLADIGLDDAGRVTTTPSTIRRYHKSYMERLHKLHPFLHQDDLERKIEGFIATYCPRASGEKPRSVKRKRSCDAFQGAGYDIRAPGNEAGSGIIEKSLDNAIVLLVLAIGYICEIRDRPVPGPVMDHVVDFRMEQMPGPSTLRVLRPAGSGLVVASQSNGLASDPPSSKFRCMGGGPNRTAGHLYLDDPNLQNRDVIPGLAFYAYATCVLGNFQGAIKLPYVQAALLAGLYAGQLAHPFQSHGWIAQAARACQVLVRTKRYEEMRDGSEKELHDFAYWTCLQLESDILAELDLPASGVSRSEGRIALPKGQFTLNLPNEISAPNTMMMFFYSAQIYLRKLLNRVHTELYKVDQQGQTHWSSNVQEMLSTNLEQWRSSLPDIMKWKDSDPPSKDINVARMRAKYYGARYIIHRPLLYYALHYAIQPNANVHANSSTSARASPTETPAAWAAGTVAPGSESQQASMSVGHGQSATGMAHFPSNPGSSRHPPPADPTPGPVPSTYRELPAKLRRACKVCIESAIMSTEAFDGIEGRPIVTNIFGTAHAQFGNMLVLSVTYKSNLFELVDRNDLERLLRRTINFLLQSRYISPSLRADARILTEIYEGIFGEPAGSSTSR